MKLGYLALLAGLLVTGPSVAFAQSIQFELRDGSTRIQQGYDGRYYDRRDDRYYDRRYHDRDNRYEERRADRGCSPRRALATASKYLHEPRIVAAYRDYYEITGYGRTGGNRGRPDGMRISTDSSCRRR